VGPIPPRPRKLNVYGVVRNEEHVIRGFTKQNCQPACLSQNTVLGIITSLAAITKYSERHSEVRILQGFYRNFVRLMKYRAETLFSRMRALALLDFHFRTRSPAQRCSRAKYVCTLDRCASGANIDRYMPRTRSHWPRGLWRGSAAARLLRFWLRIPPGAWMAVCCDCCVLSGRGLCDGLITRPEELYRLWFVVVCDLRNLVSEEVLAHGGLSHKK
jgi:hypothetical protein